MKKTTIVLILLTQINTGCATMSNRTKTILSMIGVGVVAGTIAANIAPKDENPVAHAAVWGGGAAAVTGVAGMYIFDEQKKREELDRKLEITQKELSAFRNESETNGTPVEVESESGLSRDLPTEYKGLVRPGKWSIYKISNWVSQGENSLVHQDKILRIDPPQFQPSNQITKLEGDSK